MRAPASLPCSVTHPLHPCSLVKGTGAGLRVGHWSQEPWYQVTMAVEPGTAPGWWHSLLPHPLTHVHFSLVVCGQDEVIGAVQICTRAGCPPATLQTVG